MKKVWLQLSIRKVKDDLERSCSWAHSSARGCRPRTVTVLGMGSLGAWAGGENKVWLHIPGRSQKPQSHLPRRKSPDTRQELNHFACWLRAEPAAVRGPGPAGFGAPGSAHTGIPHVPHRSDREPLVSVPRIALREMALKDLPFEE